eukprot:gene26088-34697_t
MIKRTELFHDICSKDFLPFSFGGRGYRDQLDDAIAKTSELCGVKVELYEFEEDGLKVVWATHNFAFLGGSLGCAEGEKLTKAFEYGLAHGLAVVVQCMSGGARMQEGTLSLMQMAKISVAVDALHKKGLPFVSVLCDPTYGGVSASYAMQADVKIAVSSDTRIGFAGPAVILNTMCEANQSLFDEQCPTDFQAASSVYQHGQVDMVLQGPPNSAEFGRTVATLLRALLATPHSSSPPIQFFATGEPESSAGGSGGDYVFNYTSARRIDRPQTQDIIQQVFDSFIELSGDGRVGRDSCILGGVASFASSPGGPRCSCVVVATAKGHTPTDMQRTNYGMPSPHGYRTAMRLMKLAEKFNLPVVTLVDTVGAWPTFECELLGQSEAIASNLTLMAGLTVPIVTLIVGEGGSGGALGICMGNEICMLSEAYLGVISPEGAASILGRYQNEQQKAIQFPKDCQALAAAQGIYANQLQSLGVVDHIIWERGADGSQEKETYRNFPLLQALIRGFLSASLSRLVALTPTELVQQRYQKYRALGHFSEWDHEKRAAEVLRIKSSKAERVIKKPSASSSSSSSSLLVQYLAEEVVAGKLSLYKKLAPAHMQQTAATLFSKSAALDKVAVSSGPKPSEGLSDEAVLAGRNAKAVLDRLGPSALAQWVKQQSSSRVLVTDTTMRDAHQSLLATRVRTLDVLGGARIATTALEEAFSLEMWGGATFDVCMRFLDECPWERLRTLRQACPNICFQMLLRGANAVGYTSYPDNVVQEFIRLAAENGMDVFRIFDCFNIVESMTVSIEAVLKANKVAEVCICYTGNVLTSSIYTLDYYAQLASQIKAAGAHILGIKDMAGLLRPYEVAPLMSALVAAVGKDFPIHFHTHATSSCSLATCMEMARCGCDIIDFATASMADGTSQPSLNGFVAMMEGASRSTGLSYLSLEPYDRFWAGVRDLYSPFESGMKSGTARVFEHQIPGGQYSNLLVQCQSMGLQGEQWEQVLSAYRDVNELFGDIVKVTPSSKCVGDLALYLVTRGLTTKDILNSGAKGQAIDFPESVVGLMRGELGFPHRGFPLEVEELVLKAKGISKLTVRPGLGLPPADFVENLRQLRSQWGPTLSAEQAMSSLLYPKVFADYMARTAKKGPLLRYLPTTAYLYGLLPGQCFRMLVPSALAARHLFVKTESSASSEAEVEASVELLRVGPVQKSKRTVYFRVSLSDGSVSEEQTAEVQDSGGVFVFEGPMADASKPLTEVGSPMPGVVEKLLIGPGCEGRTVTAGETLCIVSAMKMEVKVTAPRDAVVDAIAVPAPGYRVVEGALLFTLK